MVATDLIERKCKMRNTCEQQPCTGCGSLGLIRFHVRFSNDCFCLVPNVSEDM